MRTFPGHFTALKAAPGVIKAGATGRQYFDHIINTITNTARSNTNYADEHQKLLTLEYQPNPIGANTNFLAAEEIQSNIQQLTIPGIAISDKHIQALAEAAFKKSGHDTTLIARIQRDYEAEPKNRTKGSKTIGIVSCD